MTTLEMLRHAASSFPRDAQVWFRLASALIEQNQPIEALDTLKRSFELAQHDPDLCVRIGEMARHLQDDELAITALRQACRLDGLNLMAHLCLGEALLDHGQPDQALVTLLKAAELDPREGRARVLLARGLASSGRFDEAEEQLDIAMELEPQSLEALRELGRVRGAKGDAKGCLDAWDRVRRIDPEDVMAQSAFGIALSNAGRHQEAVQVLSEVAARLPGRSGPQADLGMAYLAGGATSQALSCFTRAVQCEPSSAQAHCNLGAVLHQVGQLDKAIEAFRLTSALEPNWVVGHFNLGLALEEKGDFSGARTALERARQIVPHDPEILAALDGMGPSQDLPDIARRAASTAGQSSFAGRLERIGVPDLLGFLKNSRSTGTLYIASEKQGAVVWLSQGDLTGASTPKGKRLGEILVESDVVSPELMDIAMREQAREGLDAGLLGRVLLRNSFCTREGLQSAIQQQIHDALLEILEWPAGHFSFEEVEGEVSTEDTVSIDTQMALLEAFRVLDERQR